MTENQISLIEYDIELAINKQLLKDKVIIYDVYNKVASQILKDKEVSMKMEEQTLNNSLEFFDKSAQCE